MNQRVDDFEIDDEGHWMAKLSCGHYQHVRHDPPIRVREWVLTEEGRKSRVGQTLNCKKCDGNEPREF
ncbi:MAG: DUF3565 domain-containing protein [Acidobacteria bacterium]|nr:DUF3565 domain-containing protein [Acidobacteriota bacterium]